MERRRRWPILGLLLLATACAKPHYYLAPAAPRSDELGTLLVLPMNYQVVPPNAWLEGIERIDRLVRAHLEASGHRVGSRSLRAVMDEWSSVVKAAGGLEGPDGEVDPVRAREARAELARRTLTQAQADAVVMATVVPRLVPIDGGKLNWDGVRRTLPVVFVDRLYDRRYTQTGTARVSSLLVSVFDPGGNLVFERLRGLEPLVEVRIENGRSWVEDRPDLFEDEDELRDAVQMAFEPFIESQE